MVKVTYKGNSTIVFGKYRISNGETEIPDEEFYQLMKHPSFSKRINNGKFSVPKDFSLPKTKKEEPIQEDLEDHEEGSTDQLSVKETVKLVKECEDIEFLNDILKNDSRKTVINAVKDRIKELEK